MTNGDNNIYIMKLAYEKIIHKNHVPQSTAILILGNDSYIANVNKSF